MAIRGPGSDRPAALGPAASAEDCGACFFDFREECRVFAAGEKSRRSRCGKAIEAFGRPSGLISHSRLRWTRATNELTEITMAAGVSTAQGHNFISRAHADRRASMAMTTRRGKRKQTFSQSIAGDRKLVGKIARQFRGPKSSGYGAASENQTSSIESATAIPSHYERRTSEKPRQLRGGSSGPKLGDRLRAAKARGRNF